MNEVTKELLIEEVKKLISIDNTEVEINSNYLEYFTQDEIEHIRDDLLFKKNNQNIFVEQYVQELSGILKYE